MVKGRQFTVASNNSARGTANVELAVKSRPRKGSGFRVRSLGFGIQKDRFLPDATVMRDRPPMPALTDESGGRNASLNPEPRTLNPCHATFAMARTFEPYSVPRSKQIMRTNLLPSSAAALAW